MRTLPLVLLAALVACDDGSARPEPAADGTPPDAVVADAGADAQEADAGPPLDAAPPDDPDAGPAVALALNELACGADSWVEVLAEAASPPGWRLEIDGRIVPLDVPAGFTAVPLATPLGCARSEVRLLDPSGATREVAQAPLAPSAFTWGRLPDGDGPWQITAPTPGAPNAPAPEPAFFDDQLHRVEVVLSEGAIEVLDRDRGKDVEATVRVDGGAERPAWVHITGFDGRGRRADQKTPLVIRFVEAAPDGLSGLELRPAIVDPALISEWAGLGMLAEAGVLVPRSTFATLVIDGADLGLTLVVEPVDAAFAARHFASTWHVWQGLRTEILPEAVLAFDALSGDAADRRDLTWLASVLGDEPILGQSRYAFSQDFVDWPAALLALAGEAWVGSVEGYGPRTGLLRMHIDDLNRATLLPDQLDVALRVPVNLFAGNARLHLLCRQDPSCRSAYEQALASVHAAIAAGDWPTRIRDRAAALRDAVAADRASFWPVEMFEQAAEDRARFVEARLAEVEAELACLAATEDADGDGWRCSADCRPDDPQSSIAGVEICGNGVDEDCSGVADDGADCPVCVPAQRGGKRYLICPQRVNHEAAVQLCAGLGARLARVDSAGENAWLFAEASRVRRQEYWLGLDDLADEGTFVWPDGDAPTYTRWADGEPNDYGTGEDCGHLRTDGRWNDIDCRSAMGAICDFPCEFIDMDGDGVDGCSIDCDDGDADVHPGAEDVCGDGVDQDCSGVVDDGPDCPCAGASRGSHRYLLCQEAVNFVRMEAICAERGMVPVQVDSDSENAFLWARARARRFQRWWVGLTDREVEGDYVFSDGSRPIYAAYSRGEPNDSGRAEDCIHFWENTPDWNDIGCGANNGVICEDACVRGTDADGDGAEGCGTDCDDADPGAFPGAAEICGDRVDQDCDDRVDEGCP
ncbi:MAG: lectin-like protein [bacterium]